VTGKTVSEMAFNWRALRRRYDEYRAIVSVGNAYQQGRLTADEASQAISAISLGGDVLAAEDVALVG
jgi:hypothetical protein